MRLSCKYTSIFKKFLSFRIVLDLQNNYKDSIECSHKLHMQLPKLLASYITMVQFSQLMTQYWYTVSLNFYVMSFFCSRIPQRIPETSLCFVVMSSEVPFGCDSLSSFFT